MDEAHTHQTRQDHACTVTQQPSQDQARTNNKQALKQDTQYKEQHIANKIDQQGTKEIQEGNLDHFKTVKLIKNESRNVIDGDDDNELLDMLAILAKDVNNHNYEQAKIFDQLLNEFIKDA